PAGGTGNTIVIKPSEETPLIAVEFAGLVDRIGLPNGAFNMIGGRGATAGQTLTSNPQVSVVTMTGSVKAGKQIMADAAANLRRLNLDRGGKAPAIVLDDADLHLAVDAISISRVINTGQVCNCAEVVLVQESVRDEFVEKLKTKFETTRFGDPLKDEDI